MTLTQYLLLRQLAKDVNVRLSQPLNEAPQRPVHLFATACTRGLAAAATCSGTQMVFAYPRCLHF